MPVPLAGLAIGAGRVAAGIGGRAAGVAVRRGVARGAAAIARVGERIGGATAGIIEKGWQISGAWDLAARMTDSATNRFFSEFESGITVTVVGGPEADIRRVWWLALSAAFGRYRNRIVGRRNELTVQGEWDVSGKACKVELFYRTNAYDQALAATTLPLPGDFFFRNMERNPVLEEGRRRGIGVPADAKPVDPTDDVRSTFHRGPEQLTIGADLIGELRIGEKRHEHTLRDAPTWVGDLCNINRNPGQVVTMVSRIQRTVGVFREFPVLVRGGFRDVTGYPAANVVHSGINEAIAAAPRAFVNPVDAKGNVTLPDDGRVITTAEKKDIRVQPPRPLDGATRSNLLALVAQALQNPCFLPSSPPCEPGLTGHSGMYVYPPGGNEGFADLGGRIGRPGVAIFDRPGAIPGPAPGPIAAPLSSPNLKN